MSSYLKDAGSKYLSGTNFPDGTTSGLPGIYNMHALGNIPNLSTVPVCNALCYTIKPRGEENIVNAPAILNSKGYVQFLGNLTEGYNYENNCVPLDVCRPIFISSPNSFSVNGSFLDFYGQKMTCSGGSVSDPDVSNIFTTERGVGAIVSLQLIGTGPFGISTNLSIELPFADYDQTGILFINYENSPLYSSITASETPYSAVETFTIKNSNPVQSANLGRPRPIISLDDSDPVNFNPFNGQRVMNVMQSVRGFGFNMPVNLNIDLENYPYLNNKDLVVGYPSYNVGFVEWQG